MKTRKSLYMVVIISLTYFSIKQIYEIGHDIVYDFDPDIIVFLDNFPIKFTNMEVMINYFVDILVEFPMFWYAYLNIKNINFKKYLYDWLSGYGLK